MKRNNKYGKARIEDFLRYMKRHMTESERNAFEKELQRNPFAEEALEGLESIGVTESKKDLAHLGKRISHKINRKRRFTYYRIAASVAVLMIISSVFIVVERSGVTKEPSIPEYRPVPMDIIKAEPVKKPETGQNAEPLPPPSAAIRQQQAVAKEDVAEKTHDTEAESLTEAEKTEPSREMQMLARKELMNEMPVKIKEDAGFQPAAIAYAQKRTGSAVSGRDGIQESKPVEIIISSHEEEANGKELPATGYFPPQPIDGKDEYDRYILEHIIRPDSATTGQRVVVVASFKVLTNGTLDNIKIIRSPDNKFSDEVLRLIRTGPSWKPATLNGTPVTDSVRLSVVFR